MLINTYMLITPQEKKKQWEYVPMVAIQKQRGVFLLLAASVMLRRKAVCAFVLVVKLQDINSFIGLLFEKHLVISIKKHNVLLGKVSQAIRVSFPYQHTEAACSSFLLFKSIFHKNSFLHLTASPSDSDQRAASKCGKICIPAKVHLPEVQGSCCAIRGCEPAGPPWGYKAVRRYT